MFHKHIGVSTLRTLCSLALLISVAAAEESSTLYNTPNFVVSPHSIPRHVETPHPSCIYTQWSDWSGDCPPADACGGGIQTRNRAAAGDIDRCKDIMQEKTCQEDCVHVLATKGLIVTGMVDNPASTKEEDSNSPVAVEDIRYTYGSLSDCSAGCQDIKQLDRNHDIVCVTCTNSYSCGRVGALHINKTGKLDFVRNTRQGPYAVKVDGPFCSCSFTPNFPLMTGVCSAPSYYMILTVL